MAYESAVNDAEASRTQAAADYQTALLEWESKSSGENNGEEGGVSAPVLAVVQAPTPPPLLSLGVQLRRLFPRLTSASHAADVGASSQSVESAGDGKVAQGGVSLGVCVGGECRPDKFLLIDRLLEQVCFSLLPCVACVYA
jgi:hypothetical protein